LKECGKPEPVFMKLGMYIMTPEPHLNGVLHKSLPPVCVSLCISNLSLIGNGSIKRYRDNEYTSNDKQIIGRVVFSAVRVVSKENRRLVLPRTPCF
jgi:hypothetical protein